MFKKILVATDLIDTCTAPVLMALAIASQSNGKLYILHVLESPSIINRHLVKHYKTGKEILCDSEYKSNIHKELHKNISEVAGSFSDYEIKVTTGFPWIKILKWAKEKNTDLIVLGPHADLAEKKGVVRVKGKIGSTVEGVVMRERCPVMIVNRQLSKEGLHFKNIMVSVDFSNACVCALRLAIQLAREHGSKLFVFHMLPVPPKYSQSDYDNDVRTTRKKLEEICREIPEEITYEHYVRGGAMPHLEIVEYASKHEIGLIMMGSHTKEKKGKWYVGSAVERVSYRAGCPVIVVTDPDVLLETF
jgi:nucleotide-binding universal stress UspA family protein